MTLPRDLVFNREKVYGSIIFIFIFFPFITHIYSAIFPPLLFFYFAFVDLIYKEKHKENKKNSLKEMSLN